MPWPWPIRVRPCIHRRAQRCELRQGGRPCGCSAAHAAHSGRNGRGASRGSPFDCGRIRVCGSSAGAASDRGAGVTDCRGTGSGLCPRRARGDLCRGNRTHCRVFVRRFAGYAPDGPQSVTAFGRGCFTVALQGAPSGRCRMIWTWPFKRETRSYTEDRIAAATRAAEGKAAGTAIATIEACCGLWSRGFASAESDALSPPQLSMIGRSLLTTGNSVWLLDGGRVTLPAHTWTVTGGPDPALWNYRLDIPGPSTTDTVQRSASDVIHVRIDPEVARPWSGVSPFVRCADTRDLLCEVERSLRDEHSGPVGSVIPVPSMPVREDGKSPLDDLQRDIANLKGQVVLGETTAGGWAEGRNAAPAGDWRPQRIGPMPQQYTVASRLDVERSIMGAAGVPVALVNPEAGTDSREAWRRFLHGTLAPLARIVGAELRRAGLPDSLSFNRLGASDLAGRSRAYKQLHESGMPEAEARGICGF